MIRVLLVMAMMGRVAAAPRVTGDACDVRAIATHLDVEIATSRADAGLAAALTINGHTRTITAADCAELIDAIALVVAMAEAAPTPAPLYSLAAAAPIAAGVIARAKLVPGATRLDALAGGASTYSSHGWQEQVNLGVRWRAGATSLAFEASASSEHDTLAAAAGITVWTAAATVSPCLHAGPVAACALASGGIVVGSGEGLPVTRHATTPLAALGGRLAYEGAFGDRFALRARFDLEANLATSKFDIDGMTVWTMDRVAAWAGIDLLVHIP